MTIDQIAEIHTAIGEKGSEDWLKAGNLLLKFSGVSEEVQSPITAKQLLRSLLHTLLDNDEYLKAGALLWPRHLFDPRPQYTQDIFKAIIEDNQLLIPGANGCSKSYSCIAFCYLDWRRDPEYTMIKMAAVNEEHLKRTLIAQVSQFHTAASIDMEQKCVDNELYLGLEGLPDMGIAGVIMPQGAEGTGRIRGYKPKPIRKVKHPRFGYSSRVRFYGDEGQVYRISVFKDFGSMQSAMNGPDPVKIFVTYNPDSTDRPVVLKAMPPQGWLMEDMETQFRYKSKEGWSVLRLDGAKCENVVQRKIVYPGLQTLEGYMKFVQGGGDTSSDYFEKARGFPPIKGAVNIIIAPSFPSDFRGTANFIEPPMVGATVDCAYQGEDGAVMTPFRYGLASGWTRESGDKIIFVDHRDPTKRKPRHVLQYDQQITLVNRDDTVALAQEVMEKAKQLNIKPENLGIDGTGNGFGTYSHLKQYFGDVIFIQWAAKATDKKVLNEDQAPASALYDSIISEMWFTVRRWFESGCIIISPMIDHSPLNQQLSTRRFSRVRLGLMHVESKKEYKSRGHSSPDEADSFVMAPMVIRQRHEILPGMQAESERPPADDENEKRWGQRDYNEDKNLDMDTEPTGRHLDAFET
jgi:hypothetical protein